MSRNSKVIMLTSSGDIGHPCLDPKFRENIFNFSPLRIIFAVGLSYVDLFYSDIFHLGLFSEEVFYKNFIINGY